MGVRVLLGGDTRTLFTNKEALQKLEQAVAQLVELQELQAFQSDCSSDTSAALPALRMVTSRVCQNRDIAANGPASECCGVGMLCAAVHPDCVADSKTAAAHWEGCTACQKEFAVKCEGDLNVLSAVFGVIQPKFDSMNRANLRLRAKKAEVLGLRRQAELNSVDVLQADASNANDKQSILAEINGREHKIDRTIRKCIFAQIPCPGIDIRETKLQMGNSRDETNETLSFSELQQMCSECDPAYFDLQYAQSQIGTLVEHDKEIG